MYIIVAIIGIGWVSGNLVNYLADYLPVDRKIVTPYCPNCKTPKSPAYYILYPRRCSHCQYPVRMRHWLVNLMIIVMLIYFWFQSESVLFFWQGLLLLIYFFLVIVIDIEHRLILHVVSLFGGVLGLIIGIYLHGLKSTLLGGLAGFLIMYALYQGGRLFLKSLAIWRDYSDIDEALGFGDVILTGVLGLILGWPGIVLGVIIAVVIAGISSLLYLVYSAIKHRYKANLTVAYGPYLIISAMILIFFSDLLKQLY